LTKTHIDLRICIKAGLSVDLNTIGIVVPDIAELIECGRVQLNSRLGRISSQSIWLLRAMGTQGERRRTCLFCNIQPMIDYTGCSQFWNFELWVSFEEF
jgi:hypothetical protein